MNKNKPNMEPLVPAGLCIKYGALVAKLFGFSRVVGNFICNLKFVFFLIVTLFGIKAFADTGQEIAGIISDVSNTSRVMQLLVIVTILSAAPTILIMVTSFVRISIVLSFLRSALGLQQTPPNQVLISLAMFLTFFIMAPAVEESYNIGVKPWLEEQMTESEAFIKITHPFQKFMIANTRPKDLDLFVGVGKIDHKTEVSDLPIHIVTPAFMISELRRAFEIGFLIFLPFLIIDILVASLLMAMGMMMMPPVMIALPFKIIFFVVIDGWYLIAGSLIKSFVT
ncbi:MAG: flagellar type III secretion system pore protein FliP [Rickettsiaceae bacterium]|nr:flagellar type III secretion system pore protein FliP [Rickettsiaceae bacterium]